MYKKMSEIELKERTKELCREFFRQFEQDSMLFADMSKFKPYEYSEEKADAFFESRNTSDRKNFVIMLGNEVIGEIYFKHIDWQKGICELGVGTKNDNFKNRGYGTEAEKLALKYAFEQMNMNTVLADTIHKNKRSAHVLEKAGFSFVSEDDMFRHYRIDREDWCKLRIKQGESV